jgi:hypothetical protein
MVEKLKNGGVVWNQVSPYQYRATYFQGVDCWDMFLTKMPNRATVTLDFKKNMKFFYSINSDSDPNVAALFNEVIGDDNFDKDRALMRDITQRRTCRPETFNEHMREGVFIEGISEISGFYLMLGGVIASGEAKLNYNYGSSLTAAGVKCSGRSRISKNTTFFPSSGVIVDGYSDVSSYYSPNGGVIVAGNALIKYIASHIMSGGVIVGGDALIGAIDGGGDCEVVLDCPSCPDGAPTTWSLAVSGFGGTCTSLNGDWTLTRSGRCLWSGTLNGYICRVGHSMSGWELAFYSGGTVIAGYISSTSGCCQTIPFTLSQFTGSCTPQPSTLSLVPPNGCSCAGSDCNYCAGDYAPQYTFTLSGYTDVCSIYNGTYTLDYAGESGGCVWTDGDWTLDPADGYWRLVNLANSLSFTTDTPISTADSCCVPFILSQESLTCSPLQNVTITPVGGCVALSCDCASCPENQGGMPQTWTIDSFTSTDFSVDCDDLNSQQTLDYIGNCTYFYDGGTFNWTLSLIDVGGDPVWELQAANGVGTIATYQSGAYVGFAMCCPETIKVFPIDVLCDHFPSAITLTHSEPCGCYGPPPSSGCLCDDCPCVTVACCDVPVPETLTATFGGSMASVAPVTLTYGGGGIWTGVIPAPGSCNNNNNGAWEIIFVCWTSSSGSGCVHNQFYLGVLDNAIAGPGCKFSCAPATSCSPFVWEGSDTITSCGGVATVTVTG